MVGRNFLAWHRRFLLQLEQRLQAGTPRVSIPYWDWVADPTIPAPLNDPALVQSWGVVRDWNAHLLPTHAGLEAVTSRTSFNAFQRRLEQAHNLVHEAVGGTMNTASSPADPLFWLHHANIDRIWAGWQTRHATESPSNQTEMLQPPPLFNVSVESVLDIAKLGYAYT